MATPDSLSSEETPALGDRLHLEVSGDWEAGITVGVGGWLLPKLGMDTGAVEAVEIGLCVESLGMAGPANDKRLEVVM